MKLAAKLVPLLAVGFAAPVLTQCTNPPAVPSGMTDIQTAVNTGLTPTEWQQRSRQGMSSRVLEGRSVLRANGHSLGFILGVNDIAREVEVQTPGDQAITVPESELRVEGDKVYAAGAGRLAMR